ncbi:MAG: substrate-binding domain-containing protein [Phycisphaeraceae bacterium]|nr:substrate-binding domain-containing protein [Phycisphaeraceae bacterium]
MKIGLQRKGMLGAALAVIASAGLVAWSGGLMGASEAPKKTYRIGVIAKSQSNPVFQAARTGALDAGEKLSEKLGADVKVEWRTPVNEDAQQQAQYVEQLASQGFDGIAISASDANVLTAAVNSAIDRGVVVITFDSDIPASKRLAYYGINDEEAGKSVMRELAKSMGGKGGKIAILSGNQNATNLNARVKGVKDELATLKDKGFTLKDVYYTKETASDAAALVQQVQTANPDIVGWAMVGGWPLFTQNALDGVYEQAKIVSVDHLPEQLNYVKNGQVAALIGQDCYGWGYQSVVMLVDKLNSNKDPEKVINNFPLSVVTKENVDQYEGLWNKWLKKK